MASGGNLGGHSPTASIDNPTAAAATAPTATATAGAMASSNAPTAAPTSTPPATISVAAPGTSTCANPSAATGSTPPPPLTTSSPMVPETMGDKEKKKNNAGEEPDTEATAGAEEDAESGAGNWIGCSIDSTLLEDLQKDGFLFEGQWRISEADEEPSPQDGERVMLASHIIRGLGFPPSAFFLEVLNHYGVQPHNFTPNSILYLSVFQALFEGYLGIAPRLDFFQYCFYVKRNSIDGVLPVCGTITFNLRRGREEWFQKIRTSDSVKHWTGSYFYCSDVPFLEKDTGIPPFHNSAAIPKDSWAQDGVKELPAGLLKIKRRISKLTASIPELTGMDTVLCWYHRRIQPLSHRSGRLLCTYTGQEYSMRGAASDMSDKSLCRRVNHLVSIRTQYTDCVEMYTAANPPPKFDDLAEDQLVSKEETDAKKARMTAEGGRKRKKPATAKEAVTLDGVPVAASSLAPASLKGKKKRKVLTHRERKESPAVAPNTPAMNTTGDYSVPPKDEDFPFQASPASLMRQCRTCGKGRTLPIGRDLLSPIWTKISLPLRRNSRL